MNLGYTNLVLVTNHVVKLTRLIPGRTYYFSVVSTDTAGNTATNNNSGANYTFIGAATPMVLLVDAYDTAAEEANSSTVIPDSAYTNVLTSAGQLRILEGERTRLSATFGFAAVPGGHLADYR